MKTTLNAIRRYSPCREGRTRLLTHLGKTQDDDEPLSILTILESNGLYDALWALRAVEGHDREVRLYAIWCARQVHHLMRDKRSLDALDVAERFANGLADKADAWAAALDAWAAAQDAEAASYGAEAASYGAEAAARAAACAASYGAEAAAYGAEAAARAAAWAAAEAAAEAAARAASYGAEAAARAAAWAAAEAAACAAQKQKLIDACKERQ